MGQKGGRMADFEKKSTASGRVFINNAVVVQIVSIDRRWRDRGRSSVLVMWRVGNDQPEFKRLWADDVLVSNVNVDLIPTDNRVRGEF